MIVQPIVNIAEICARHGIRNVVISPGSRSALITLAFARHPDIEVKVVPDERSAGFIALGLAMGTTKTVGVVCTSGTAALNLAPALTEAFYQQIPLIAFTADRPPEWIDQYDGQTIRQQNLYANHIKKSFCFPASFNHPDEIWHAGRMINEAIVTAEKYPSGPVQVNVPVREPFYPDVNEKMDFDQKIPIIQHAEGKKNISAQEIERLEDALTPYHKIIMLIGQHDHDAEFGEFLDEISASLKIPVAGDVISNMHGCNHVIRHHDGFLFSKNHYFHQDLQPDLVISFGKSIIAKNLKTFLRKSPGIHHWQIAGDTSIKDTFQHLSQLWDVDEKSFLEALLNSKLKNIKTSQSIIYNKWVKTELEAKTFHRSFLDQTAFGEFKATYQVLQQLPSNSILHLANSMPVRYANYVTLTSKQKDIRVFANRGTSGIDGCTSTAVGIALTSEKINTLITGDMAFFYDRNGLWHSSIPSNLRIIIMNNHGGGIFRIIPGPDRLPELEEYFETQQPLNAANTAKDFGLEYHICRNQNELEALLPDFFRER